MNDDGISINDVKRSDTEPKELATVGDIGLVDAMT
jgi:hypothetical protein